MLSFHFISFKKINVCFYPFYSSSTFHSFLQTLGIVEMHTQICPLTQGSWRWMARLKPLLPCAMYTLKSTFNSEISHKFYPKKYIQSSKNPKFLNVSLTSPGFLPFTPAVSPHPPPRGPSCRKDTWRQDQHKMASKSWPWKLRKTTSCKASLCTLGGGKGEIDNVCSWYFGTRRKKRQKIDAKQLSILEQFDNWGMDRLKRDLFARQRKMPEIKVVYYQFGSL